MLFFKTKSFHVGFLMCYLLSDLITKLFCSVTMLLRRTLELRPGFNLSFGSPVVKIYPFATLCWVNKDEKMYSNKFSYHRTIYFPQLLKINLSSEIIVSQAQPIFICLSSAVIKVEKSVKYVQS